MPADSSTEQNDFPVRIQTPESLVWEGRAESLSSVNSAGPFDILPQHANMITIIEKQPIEVSSKGGSRRFTFDKAVVSVQNGAVTIFANIATGGAYTKEKERSS